MRVKSWGKGTNEDLMKQILDIVKKKYLARTLSSTFLVPYRVINASTIMHMMIKDLIVNVQCTSYLMKYFNQKFYINS